MSDTAAMVEWLREAYDRLERTANAAEGINFRIIAATQGEAERVRAHVACHEPVHVLVAAAVGRRILAEYEAQGGTDFAPQEWRWLVRELAYALSHLPGYREEWKP